MAVNIKRYRDTAVPEHGLYHFGRYALLQEPGGVRVARIVQADSEKAGAFKDLREVVGVDLAQINWHTINLTNTNP